MPAGSGGIPILSVTRSGDADYGTDATFVGRGFQPSAAVTTDGALVCGANASALLGVLTERPRVGASRAMSLTVLGTCKVRSGAAFAVAALLKTDAAGKFITGGGAGDFNAAIALDAAAEADDLVEALLVRVKT